MKTLNVSIDMAREWYNGSDEVLRKLALEYYSVDELKVVPFEEIKTFEDAVNELGKDIEHANFIVNVLEHQSKASAAMYKLNIVRKALNLGQDLHFVKDPENSEIYYPYVPFVIEDSTYYDDELNSGIMEIIGKIKVEGEEYNVLGGCSTYGCPAGLGCFYLPAGVGYAEISSIFGFANEEIAEHFSKYFGMLITEVKFGDLDGFEIIERKYGNA